MKRQNALITLMTTICTVSFAAFGLPFEEKPRLTPDAVEAIKVDVGLAMQNIRPESSKNHSTTAILPNERFVMWGDLFSNGHVWAIVETQDKSGVAYLEWKNDHWLFREVWDIAACWLPEGIKPRDRGYYHIHPTPPPQAFKLKNVNSDGSPAILIPFNNDGYDLGYAIAVPLPNHAGIKIVEFSMSGEPDAAAGYLITYNTSGRKAWWGQRLYHKWVDGKTMHQVTWTEGNVGETDMGPTWLTIDTTASSPVGEQHYRVLKDEDLPSHRVLRNDAPFAVVEFCWDARKVRPQDATIMPAAEALYLFERLTGLQWKAYGDDIYGIKVKDAKIGQKALTTQVTGTPEGIKTLSPASKVDRK
jgi:hypothetical protein